MAENFSEQKKYSEENQQEKNSEENQQEKRGRKNDFRKRHLKKNKGNNKSQKDSGCLSCLYYHSDYSPQEECSYRETKSSVIIHLFLGLSILIILYFIQKHFLLTEKTGKSCIITCLAFGFFGLGWRFIIEGLWMFVWKWTQRFNPIDCIYSISSLLISIIMPFVMINKDIHIEMSRLFEMSRLSQDGIGYYFNYALFIFSAVASWWLFFTSSTNDFDLGEKLIHARSRCCLKEPSLCQKEQPCPHDQKC